MDSAGRFPAERRMLFGESEEAQQAARGARDLMDLHIHVPWILQAAEAAGVNDPAPDDYGVPVSAVARHRAESSDSPPAVLAELHDEWIAFPRRYLSNESMDTLCTDTLGLVLPVLITPVSTTDREAARASSTGPGRTPPHPGSRQTQRRHGRLRHAAPNKPITDDTWHPPPRRRHDTSSLLPKYQSHA